MAGCGPGTYAGDQTRAAEDVAATKRAVAERLDLLYPTPCHRASSFDTGSWSH
jgi:hypothetical protein